MIVLDTGGLYALLDSSDDYHDRAHAAVGDYHGPLLLSPLVLAETERLVASRLGRQAEAAFLGDVVDKVYQLTAFGDDELQLATDLITTYAHMNVSLPDASVAVIAGRHQTVDLLSIDQQFRAIGPLWGSAFRLLPLDQ